MEGKNFDKFREETLSSLGLDGLNSGVFNGKWLPTQGRNVYHSTSPVDGKHIADLTLANREDFDSIVATSQKVFEEWREYTAPQRGEIVRSLGDLLVKRKKDLGALVTIEVGKTPSEGAGEIQEMIDIAYFASGLSRQLYGLTMGSERPYHRLYEQWVPLGPTAVISAFNFPSAVWSWNAMIAAVCGDTVIWKPSTKAALVATGVMKAVSEALTELGAPQIFSLMVSKGSDGGEWISNEPRIPLVSFTGSTDTGRNLYEKVSRRIGRSILELGGNNCAIVTDKSDMKIALKGVAFGALATAGQRCTSTRRVLIQKDIYGEFIERLKNVYENVKIGNPGDDGVLVGPLIDKKAIKTYLDAIETAKSQGGKVLLEGKPVQVSGFEGGNYVKPAIVEATQDMDIIKTETFGPLLYVFKYGTMEEALRMHNDVPQGLSSAIFTNDLREEEEFLSARGSDCGIANVNTSTAGAEIGGAFGGEKQTGYGRESGSDAWKAYMRRQTVTKNFGNDVPLAQGVKFEV